MGSVNVTHVKDIADVTIDKIRKIEKIEKIAPAAIHVKELNHIDPISVESLRIDQVRNLDPVRVERLNVTHVPTVNLAMSRMPAMDVNLRRIPPLAVGLHQDFQLPSEYTVNARFLGIEVLRFNIHGQTLLKPRDRVRREQVTTHERSYKEVAAVGNPAIPVTRTERCVETKTRMIGDSLPERDVAPAVDMASCWGLRAGGAPSHFAVGGKQQSAPLSGSAQPSISAVGQGR